MTSAKRYRCEGCGDFIPQEEVMTFHGTLAHEYPAEDGEPSGCLCKGSCPCKCED